jgi:DNA replication protein DnaC
VYRSISLSVRCIELLLSELRLPAIKLMWAALAARADKEGWPAARFLAALAEHEIADRGRRRIERHLASARLPAGKTFDTRIASSEKLPDGDLLPQLICSPPVFNGRGKYEADQHGDA